MNKFRHAKPQFRRYHEDEYQFSEIAAAVLGDTYAEDLIFLYLKGMGPSPAKELAKYLEELNAACAIVGMAQTALAGFVDFARVDGEVGFKPVATEQDAERNRKQLENARRKIKLAGL